MTETCVYQTSFGMFVPCDKQVYKKLKRINHFWHQTGAVWSRRWNKAQRRLPKNRIFILRWPGAKRPFTAKDSWLFFPFCERVESMVREYDLATDQFVKKQQVSYVLTSLFKDFTADLIAARNPVKTAEEVKPMKLSPEQIDGLLSDIEVWQGQER